MPLKIWEAYRFILKCTGKMGKFNIWSAKPEDAGLVETSLKTPLHLNAK